jgi:hypothetical protein
VQLGKGGRNPRPRAKKRTKPHTDPKSEIAK